MPDALTNFWFLLFGMITAIVVVGILARAWSVVQRARAGLDCKMLMIQRGMSVEEIERVLAAGTDSEDRYSPGPLGVDEDSLEEVVSVLAEHNASAAVIEQVLLAFRSVDAPTQRLVSRAIQSLLGNAPGDVEGEQILAVVRPLCQAREPAASLPPVREGAFHA